MSVKIKLARGEGRNNPFYRVVVINSKRNKTSNALEIVGFWQPKKNLKKVDKKRIDFWKGRGAKTTPAVENLCAN